MGPLPRPPRRLPQPLPVTPDRPGRAARGDAARAAVPDRGGAAVVGARGRHPDSGLCGAAVGVVGVDGGGAGAEEGDESQFFVDGVGCYAEGVRGGAGEVPGRGIF